jgi:phage shock protein C
MPHSAFRRNGIHDSAGLDYPVHYRLRSTAATRKPNRRTIMDMADQLQKLQTLRDQGTLTEEEFTLAKKRVIDGSASPDSAARASANTPSSSALNQFTLSATDKWIGGVCGGLAAQTNVPSWSWRILFLLTTLLHGLGLLVYILLWIFVPVQASQPKVVAGERQ